MLLKDQLYDTIFIWLHAMWSDLWLDLKWLVILGFRDVGFWVLWFSGRSLLFEVFWLKILMGFKYSGFEVLWGWELVNFTCLCMRSMPSMISLCSLKSITPQTTWFTTYRWLEKATPVHTVILGWTTASRAIAAAYSLKWSLNKIVMTSKNWAYLIMLWSQAKSSALFVLWESFFRLFLIEFEHSWILVFKFEALIRFSQLRVRWFWIGG